MLGRGCPACGAARGAHGSVECPSERITSPETDQGRYFESASGPQTRCEYWCVRHRSGHQGCAGALVCEGSGGLPIRDHAAGRSSCLDRYPTQRVHLSQQRVNLPAKTRLTSCALMSRGGCPPEPSRRGAKAHVPRAAEDSGCQAKFPALPNPGDVLVGASFAALRMTTPSAPSRASSLKYRPLLRGIAGVRW